MQFLFGEILIFAKITVLREILKYLNYDESLPSGVQWHAEKIRSQLVSFSFTVLYICVTSDIN